MTEAFSYGLENIREAAVFVIEKAKPYQIWCFYGQMGSGKTTLIKKICELLHVTSRVSSPTFSLVNEYETDTHEIIYHFDFYRIKSVEEIYDIGYEDYFYGNNLCLIEWPELAEHLIPKQKSCKIHIRLQNNHRVLWVEPNL